MVPAKKLSTSFCSSFVSSGTGDAGREGVGVTSPASARPSGGYIAFALAMADGGICLFEGAGERTPPDGGICLFEGAGDRTPDGGGRETWLRGESGNVTGI